MAKLGITDKIILEKLFGMDTGYVLDFSDARIQAFIGEQVGRDIYGGSYSKYGTSKAKHLRAFWDVETDQVVGLLTERMIEYGLAKGFFPPRMLRLLLESRRNSRAACRLPTSMP